MVVSFNFYTISNTKVFVTIEFLIKKQKIFVVKNTCNYFLIEFITSIIIMKIILNYLLKES